MIETLDLRIAITGLGDVGRLEVSLRDVGREAVGVEGRVERLDRGVGRLAATTGRSTGVIGRMGQALKSWLGPLVLVTAGFLSASGAIRGIEATVGAATTVETINRSMLAATGSSAAAARSMAFMRQEVDRLGLDLQSTAQDFTKLAASAKGTALEGAGVQQVFSAVSTATTVLGLSSDQSSGILLALSQTMSKGRLQMEELLQIAERLPGTLGLMARGMGVTTAELIKMMAQGKVAAEVALPALARELERAFGDQAQDAARSTRAELNRFRTAVFDLQEQVGSRLAPVIADAASRIATFFKESSGAIDEFAGAVGTVISATAETLLFLADHVEIVKAALLALIAIKLTGFLVAFLTGLGKAIAEMTAYTGATGGTTAAQTIQAGTVARTIPIFGAQGRVISTVTSQTVAWSGATYGVAAANTAASRAVTLFSTSLTRVLGIVGVAVAVFSLLDSAIDNMASAYERDIDKAVAATVRFRAEEDLLTEALESGSRALVEASIANYATQQAEAARQLSEAWFDVTAATQGLAEAQGRLNAARAAGGRQRLEGGEGLASSLARSAETPADQEYRSAAAAVEHYQRALEEAQRVQGEATATDRSAQDALVKLRDALANIGQREAAERTEELTKRQQKLVQNLNEATEAALANARAAAALGAVQAEGPRVVAELSQQMDIQRAVIERRIEAERAGVASSEAFKRQLEEFREALLAEAAAERYLAGEETVERLRRAVVAEEALLVATRQGAAAAAQAAQDQELLADVTEATTDATVDQVPVIADLVSRLHELRRARLTQERILDLGFEVNELERLTAAAEEGRAALRKVQEQLRFAADLRQAVTRATGLQLLAELALLQAREAGRRAFEDQQTLAPMREQNLLLQEQLELLNRYGNSAAGLRKVALELEVFRRLLAAGAEAGSKLGAEIRAIVEEEFRLNDQIALAEGQFNAWEFSINGVIAAFGELGGAFGRLGQSIARGIDAWKEYRDARAAAIAAGVDPDKDPAVQAAGANLNASVGAAFGAGVSMLGLGGGGTSSFGGQMSGTYADLGGQLGSSFGPWGQFVGTIIGSFVKSGADDALVIIGQSATEATATVAQAEGGLKDVAQQIAATIGGFLNDVQNLLDLSLDIESSGLRISVRNEFVTVVVNGLKQVFRSIEEALAWAAQQVLSANADAEGLGENVRRLFENLSGLDVVGSLDELARALELAQLADNGLAPSLREISDLRKEEMRLALQYGLVMADVLALTQQRLQAARDEAQAQALAFVGASNTAGGLRDVLAGLQAYNEEVDREIEGRKTRMSQIEEEIAAIQERGGALDPAVIRQWRDEARQAGLTWEGFTGTLDENQRAALKDAELLERLREEYAALAESLGEIPEKFTEAFIEMVREVGSLQDQLGFFNELLAFQEKYGVEIVKNDALREHIAELEFRLAQIRIQLLVIELAKNAELLNLSRAQLNQYRAWAEEVAGLEFTGLAAGAAGGRGQERQSVRERFAEDLAALERRASGLASSTIQLVEGFAAFEESIAAARAAGVAEEDLARARRANAAIVRRDFLAGFEESARQAGEQAFETDLRHFIEGFSTALQDAFVVASEAARANGTTLEQEFGSIVAVMGEGFQAQFQNLAGELIDSFVGDGDLAGLLAFRDALLTLEVPPELRAFFEAILPDLLDDIDAAVAAIGEQSIDDLGLPLEALRDHLTDLAATLTNIAGAVAEGAITAERAAQVYAELGAQAFADLGGQTIDFLDRYFADVKGFEELRRQLEQARFALEVAQLELQLAMLSDLGLLTEEQQAMIRGVIDYARENAPDFAPEEGGGAGRTDPLSVLLPSFDQAIRQAQSMADALRALEKQFNAGEIGAWRYSKALELAGLQAFTTLGDQLMGFIERYYGGVEGFEDFRVQLEQARFTLELANLRLQFQLVKDLGLLTQAQIDTIEGALTWVSANTPDFTAPPPTPDAEAGRGRHRVTVGGKTFLVNDGPSGAQDSQDTSKLDNVRERIASQVEAWNELGIDPVERDLRRLTKTFDDLKKELLDAGGSAEELADLEAALAVARQDVIDRQLDPVRDALAGLRNEDPRKTGSERFGDLQARFLETVARVNAGDLSAAREAADLGLQLEQLGQRQFGTAGSAYDDLRDLIEGQLGGLVGETTDPALGLQQDQLGVQEASLEVLQGIHAALAPANRRGTYDLEAPGRPPAFRIVVEPQKGGTGGDGQRQGKRQSVDDARRREREKSEERRRQDALFAATKETNRVLGRLLAAVEAQRPAGGGKST